MNHRGWSSCLQFVDELESLSGSLLVAVPAGLATRQQLLLTLDQQLHFPDYFGGNWDALWECICDLRWINVRKVTIRHADIPLVNDPQQASTYVRILNDAACFWARRQGYDLIVSFPARSEAGVQELMRLRPRD
jgi:RNAse (barnase) inhibitor barstar